MAFIETTAARHAEGSVREMYARQQSHWGYVPNYAKVFCHRPEVLARWGRLLAEIRRPMDSRRFELVTFAAARVLNNKYCLLEHGRKLTGLIGDEDVKRLADNEFDGDNITAAERAMMRFAQNIARDASKVTQGEVAALREHGFSDEEIFDIAAAAAGRAFFTKLVDGLGSEPDACYLDLDEDFRFAMKGGRPIDFKPLETLSPDGG